MAESSFDIVSEINKQELTNAVDQAQREIATRFDFKDTDSYIEMTKEELTIGACDENKLNQLIDVLQTKLVKRGISLKALTFGKMEGASGGHVRQKITFVAGIDVENSKKIHKIIKDSGIKVKSQTMDQKVRVTGKSRDELQEVMALLKRDESITIPLNFNNYK